MDPLSERQPTQEPQGLHSQEGSMFHDRHEPYFVDWVLGQGLPHDASDGEVAIAMESYIAKTGQQSIQSAPVPKTQTQNANSGRPYIE